MLKKLSKKEVQRFVGKFEIKCSNVKLEEIQNEYYIIIDEVIRFQIHNYDLIKEFIQYILILVNVMNRIVESYCELIRKIEVERNKILEEIYTKGKDTEFNKQYLRKYNQLLEQNYEVLWHFINS